MRSAHHPPLRSSSVALVAALALAGCGGGDGTAETAATSSAAPGQPAAEAPADLSNLDMPFFTGPIDEPKEFEEAVEKPFAGAFPEDSAATPRPDLAGLPPADPILGEPLVVEGEVVPFERIKREICLGPLGQGEIADERTRIFIDEERQRRVQGGASEGLTVPETEIEEYLSTVEQGIQAEFPDGSVDMKDFYAELSSYDPRAKIRYQMDFALLFLPDDPAQFPPVTLEAILKNPAGQAILEHYKTSFDPAAGPREKDAGEMQFDQTILQQILGHLMEVSTITADPAPGILYRVNGVDIAVDTIWERILPRVTPVSLLSAKQWLVKTMLLEKALQDAGAWLTDEEAYIAYHAHSDPYKDSMFSVESIALKMKNFPSVERYKHYRRLMDSFKRLRNPSEAELTEYAKQRTNKVLGQVTCDVDIILCSAFDFRFNTWPENGWQDAATRMKEVVRLLVEEQRPWEEMVAQRSEFYEMPVAASQPRPVDPERPGKGQFRNVQRNALTQYLGETDYGIFLTGSCVTDTIFFAQEVGTIASQPIRGPFGWYLPRLLQRSKPPTRIPMDEGTQRDLVLDDYLTTELARFADQLVREKEVYGLD